MAWNEPGNQGESPWGKKRPAGKPGGIDETRRNLQQKLQAALGGRSTEPPAGGDVGQPPGNMGWMLAAGVAVLWLASGFYQIDAADRGVVQRFGRHTDVRPPGFGMVFPWPIERITKVNVSKINNVEYRSRVLTADVNLVEIRAAVQYQNADPVKVLFEVKELENTL
jgi:membrane protease subunit HflK